jgi:hypothetical protein
LGKITSFDAKFCIQNYKDRELKEFGNIYTKYVLFKELSSALLNRK